MTSILQNYWGSTTLYLPFSLQPVSTLFPTLQASFLYKQTHLVRERHCLSVFWKPAFFLKDGLGKSLKGWSAGGESQWEEPGAPQPIFLIFRVYQLGREGYWDDD